LPPVLPPSPTRRSSDLFVGVGSTSPSYGGPGRAPAAPRADAGPPGRIRPTGPAFPLARTAGEAYARGGKLRAPRKLFRNAGHAYFQKARHAFPLARKSHQVSLPCVS